MCLRISTFLFLAMVLAPPFALAETGYVTDQLVLTLRSGPGNQYEVLDHLKSDSKLEILDAEGKFAKVRTTTGKEGFVQKQYITEKLPKSLVVARQAKEIEQLRKQVKSSTSSGSQQQQQLASLQKENAELLKGLAQSQSELEQLTREHQQLLDASGNLLQTTQERDLLQEANQNLVAEAAELRAENTDLLTTGSIKWFLAGAGVLFFGWFMGKISRKQRRPF